MELGTPLLVYETPLTEFVARFLDVAMYSTVGLGGIQVLTNKAVKIDASVRPAVRLESIQLHTQVIVFQRDTVNMLAAADTTHSVMALVKKVTFSGAEHRLRVKALGNASLEVLLPSHAN